MPNHVTLAPVSWPIHKGQILGGVTFLCCWVHSGLWCVCACIMKLTLFKEILLWTISHTVSVSCSKISKRMVNISDWFDMWMIHLLITGAFVVSFNLYLAIFLFCMKQLLTQNFFIFYFYLKEDKKNMLVLQNKLNIFYVHTVHQTFIILCI